MLSLIIRRSVASATRHHGSDVYCPLSATVLTITRTKSSNASARRIDPSAKGGDNENGVPPHPQDFVKDRFEPGQYSPLDRKKKDPLFRPAWKNRARIVSSDDYANRPSVGFGDEFQSLHDAQIILSWLSHEYCEKIYHEYLDYMVKMHQESKKTSHEYVVRVLAQRHNLSETRIAAVIASKHHEHQMRKNQPELIDETCAMFVDMEYERLIKQSYEDWREPAPKGFVEDPADVGGNIPGRGGHKMVATEDILDFEKRLQDTIIREQEEAQLKIDNHIYIEDVDRSKIDVKVNAECRKLLNNKKKRKGEEEQLKRPDFMSPLALNGKAKERRPRWKYSLQTIETNGKKKQENMLIEEDGNLRVATEQEVHHSSSKANRNVKEFILSDVKQAWLERTLHGKDKVWGAAPPQDAAQIEARKKAAMEYLEQNQRIWEAELDLGGHRNPNENTEETEAKKIEKLMKEDDEEGEDEKE